CGRGGGGCCPGGSPVLFPSVCGCGALSGALLGALGLFGCLSPCFFSLLRALLFRSPPLFPLALFALLLFFFVPVLLLRSFAPFFRAPPRLFACCPLPALSFVPLARSCRGAHPRLGCTRKLCSSAAAATRASRPSGAGKSVAHGPRRPLYSS